MPEVERPEFRKDAYSQPHLVAAGRSDTNGWRGSDAKQTERSFKGKGVGDFRGIVRFFEGSMSVQL